MSSGKKKDLRFISMYSALNTLSEYIYIYLHITFILSFKIVESLLCIFKNPEGAAEFVIIKVNFDTSFKMVFYRNINISVFDTIIL